MALREKAGWNHARRRVNAPGTPKVGDLVLVEDKFHPRNLWAMGRIEELRGSDGHVRSVLIRMSNGRIWGRPVNKICPLEEAPPKMDEMDDQADQAVQEQRGDDARAVETQSEVRGRNEPSAATKEENEGNASEESAEKRGREVEAVQPDGGLNREIRKDNSLGNGPNDSDEKCDNTTTTEKVAVFEKAAEVPLAAHEEAGNLACPNSAQGHEKKYLGDGSMAPGLLNVPTKFQPNPTRSEGGDRFGADGPQAVQADESGDEFPEATAVEQQQNEFERTPNNPEEEARDEQDTQGVQAVPEVEPRKSTRPRRNRAVWSPERHVPRKRGRHPPLVALAVLMTLLCPALSWACQPTPRAAPQEPAEPGMSATKLPCHMQCTSRGVRTVSGQLMEKIEICCPDGCWTTIPTSTVINYELPDEMLIHGYSCSGQCWRGLGPRSTSHSDAQRGQSAN
ncbi:hypothetical protein niasHS_007022 [Heterodera schachtii]|uniref:DUF5641 domain-containing protein n=1 Tax=Heterodera schachtii TaxID=97005 RepID=A0ABD2JFA9_HETSC